MKECCPVTGSLVRCLTVAQIVWLRMLRRKDAYVLLILAGALLLTLALVNVMGFGGISGYVKDVGLLMAWVLGWILAINAGVRELPDEEARGTIFPLLAKPVRRGELVAGKWLGAWTSAAAALLVFYAIVLGVTALRGGEYDLVTFLQGYGLHATALGILSAIGLAFSTRANRDAAGTLAYVTSAAAFLLVPRIPELLAREEGVRGQLLAVLYYLLPHLELFDLRKRMVHDFGPMRWDFFAGICAYGAILILMLLVLAWLGYRGKRFARGGLPV